MNEYEHIEAEASETLTLDRAGSGPTGAGEVAKHDDRAPLAWNVYGSPVYRCEVRLHNEGDVFSATVPALPGVVSEGTSEEEAVAMIREALVAALETYRALGVEIPWTNEVAPLKGDDRSVWIVVHG